MSGQEQSKRGRVRLLCLSFSISFPLNPLLSVVPPTFSSLFSLSSFTLFSSLYSLSLFSLLSLLSTLALSLLFLFCSVHPSSSFPFLSPPSLTPLNLTHSSTHTHTRTLSLSLSLAPLFTCNSFHSHTPLIHLQDTLTPT